MNAGRNWTKAEEEMLCEMWGRVSIDGICRRLGRSKNSVIVKKDRLGLGRFLDNGEYVTVNALFNAFCGHSISSYNRKSWFENRAFPVKQKRVGNNTFRIVYLEEFWKWAEENRSFLDFSRLEPLSLGPEPDWVDGQRRKDFHAKQETRKDVWTNAEDSRLKWLIAEYKYSYADLARVFCRSEGAIQKRIQHLEIKGRPIAADNHGSAAEWTDVDFEILCEGIKNGDSYKTIAGKIGKSEKACRGKVYYIYLTENLDKARKLIGEGKWGDNAPVPTVKQGASLASTRAAVKRNLSILDALLRKRMNDLGYDPYWQRFMCMNWDDIGGCAAGGKSCDECGDLFRRIQPQYCARCGGTFYERKENRFCGQCRKAKKKAAQRKWASLNNKH